MIWARILAYITGTVDQELLLRSALPPEQLENAMVSTVRSIDPQLTLAHMQTMEHAVSATEAPRRFNTGLTTAFAVAGVLLAMLGIYGIISLLGCPA